jgi:hypothetical protein
VGQIGVFLRGHVFVETPHVLRRESVGILPDTFWFCQAKSCKLHLVQFGSDAKLAAQCAQVPTPDGWRPWADLDGAVPDALAKRRDALAADQGVPLGATESYPLPGVVTLIRVEPRIWGKDDKGNVVQGCFRSAVVYLPYATASGAGLTAPSGMSGWQKAATVLTVASLSVGTVATIVSLRKS